MIPIAGSAYTYTYATLGELVAWIIGWDLILEYAFSNMSVSVGFAAHVVDLLDWFGIHPFATMWGSQTYHPAFLQNPYGWIGHHPWTVRRLSPAYLPTASRTLPATISTIPAGTSASKFPPSSS